LKPHGLRRAKALHVSDPNNLDDPEYIVRLIGKAITVSVKTVRLVDDLAGRVKVEDWMGGVVEGSKPIAVSD
jgi:hypothetical protein